jgi:hypothetical protein
VLLAVYILSGFDIKLAIEFCRSKSSRDDMEDEEIQEATERLYLQKSLDDLVELENLDGRIHWAAARFVASCRARNFVVLKNMRFGVAPDTTLVAQHFSQSAAALSQRAPNLALQRHLEQAPACDAAGRRQVRRWGQRFRRRWGFRLGEFRPAEPVSNEEIIHKACGGLVCYPSRASSEGQAGDSQRCEG